MSYLLPFVSFPALLQDLGLGFDILEASLESGGKGRAQQPLALVHT